MAILNTSYKVIIIKVFTYITFSVSQNDKDLSLEVEIHPRNIQFTVIVLFLPCHADYYYVLHSSRILSMSVNCKHVFSIWSLDFEIILVEK